MKRKIPFVLVWLILMLVAFFQHACGQLIYETVWVDYDSAISYKSLQIVPIRPRDPAGQPARGIISIKRALEEGLVTISERGAASTENVHWLRLRNHSDKTIFVASGQTFTGGRQDRMVTRDTLLEPTGGDQYFSVMCIEEGRWSKKEKPITYDHYANQKLRSVLDRNPNQALVWKEIFSQLDIAGFQAPTFAYAATRQDRAYQAEEQGYLDYFLGRFRKSDSSAIGFVAITGNRVIGTEIFAYKAMFYDELESLLYAFVAEAIQRGDWPVLSRDEIKEYMDQILTNETMQEEYCKKNGKIFRVGGKPIHVTAY